MLTQGKKSMLVQIPLCKVTLIMIIQSSSRQMAKPIISYYELVVAQSQC